ncbi:rCG27106 [Rattus norvegicus]|uniref:RCG27106 n=1 Tax=Rattus norvegicus TaxID=10116 RepID=A6HLR3_RAT|nr:rCG27106 [Rattus norvegicus]
MESRGWLLSRDCSRGWGFSSVVEHLPRKRKALGSVPSSEKKKKKNKKKRDCSLSCDNLTSAFLYITFFYPLLSLLVSYLLANCMCRTLKCMQLLKTTTTETKDVDICVFIYLCVQEFGLSICLCYLNVDIV